MQVGDLLARLDGVRCERNGQQWNARCPCHEDKRNSLSVGVGDDGRILLKCLAGCDTPAVVERLGVSMSDLMPDQDDRPLAVPTTPKVNGKPRRTFETAEAAIDVYRSKLGTESIQYHYTDADGETVGVVVRFDGPDGKTIRPVARTPDGWTLGQMPSPRPLYRLPDVRAADEVFVVEGEKAADSLYDCGYIATTSAGGSSAADQTDWTPLAGKSRVYVWPDADAAGEKYANTVTTTLQGLDQAPHVVRVTMPNAGKGDDAADLVEREDDPHEVVQGMIAAAVQRVKDEAAERMATGKVDPRQTSAEGPDDRKTDAIRAKTAGTNRHLVIRSANDVEEIDVPYLWSGWIPCGYLSLIAGETGSGKGFVTTSIVSAVTTRGGRFPDGAVNESPGHVLILCNEDAPETMLKPRLVAAGADCSKVSFLEVANVGGIDQPINIVRHLDLLEGALQEYDPRLLVVDPIDDVALHVDSNTAEDVRSAFVPFLKLLQTRFPLLGFLGVKHTNKNTRETNPKSRINGSGQWLAISRAAHLVIENPEEPGGRYVLPVKVQFGENPPGRSFRISPSRERPGVGVALFDDFEADVTATDVLHMLAKGKRPREWERAANWLVDALSEAGGHMLKRDAVAKGEPAGFKQRTLETAVTKDPRLEKDHVGSMSWWRVSKPVVDTF